MLNLVQHLSRETLKRGQGDDFSCSSGLKLLMFLFSHELVQVVHGLCTYFLVQEACPAQ